MLKVLGRFEPQTASPGAAAEILHHNVNMDVRYALGALHIGVRVSALAGPGEVLVTSTVKDLVIGSELQFDDRGAQSLKGVPGDWHLWAAN